MSYMPMSRLSTHPQTHFSLTLVFPVCDLKAEELRNIFVINALAGTNAVELQVNFFSATDYFHAIITGDPREVAHQISKPGQRLFRICQNLHTLASEFLHTFMGLAIRIDQTDHRTQRRVLQGSCDLPVAAR